MNTMAKAKFEPYPVHEKCIYCGGPVGLGHGSTGVCSWCIVRPGKFKMRQMGYFTREMERAPKPV